MNVGGPAYHVSVLSGRLNPQRFETLLVHGEVGLGEGSFADLADAYGCRREVIEHLGPEIRPLADLRALLALVRVVRRFRPHIVHTHTAKAGVLGRLAALLGSRPRPLIVHTFHGHVLEGYFGRWKSGFYRLLERGLAPATDCLIGVSRATVHDLVRLGVATRDRFRVIPIGLDLRRFTHAPPGAGADVRDQLGADSDHVVLAYVGRLVAIKRVDVLLEAVARASSRARTPIRLGVVGDGDQRETLQAASARLGLDGMVTFLGFMGDVSGVVAAADIAVLSSANEGTPVALIEAAAAGRPAVATAVGGVPDVVVAERTGLLVSANDPESLADALVRLVDDPELRIRMGRAAREHVLGRFASPRLVADMEELYAGLVGSRPELKPLSI